MSPELELKAQLDEIGKTLHAERKVNDELKARQDNLEGGQAELKVQLEKISDIADAQIELKENMEKTMAAVKRQSSDFDEGLEAKGIEVKDYNAGIKSWLKAGMPESIERLNLPENQVKALQSNIDPEGGYTIHPHLGGIEKRLFDTSPIRSKATVISINTNRYEGFYDDDEFDTGWIGEIQSRSETDTANIGKFALDMREIYSRFKVSANSMEDSSWNLESWSSAHVADKMGRTEATAFISGAGPLQPQGIITGTVKTASPKVYARGQIGTLDTAGATAITSDELVDVQDILKTGYRPEWFMNRGTRSYVRKLKDGDGNYLWQTSYQMSAPDELLGKPVCIFEDMPDIASGAIAVGYGDIRETYMIVDRAGMSILKDPYTAAQTGQIVFQFKRRVTAGIKNWDAMKYLRQA